MCCTKAECCLLVMQFMPDRLTESTSDNALTGTRSVAGLFVFIAAWHEWAAVCIELTGGYCDSAVEKTNNRTDKKNLVSAGTVGIALLPVAFILYPPELELHIAQG